MRRGLRWTAAVAMLLAGMFVFAADDAATREKEGAAKLRKDLATARRVRIPA